MIKKIFALVVLILMADAALVADDSLAADRPVECVNLSGLYWGRSTSTSGSGSLRLGMRILQEGCSKFTFQFVDPQDPEHYMWGRTFELTFEETPYLGSVHWKSIRFDPDEIQTVHMVRNTEEVFRQIEMATFKKDKSGKLFVDQQYTTNQGYAGDSFFHED
jgi:hypothetical protein